MVLGRFKRNLHFRAVRLGACLRRVRAAEPAVGLELKCRVGKAFRRARAPRPRGVVAFVSPSSFTTIVELDVTAVKLDVTSQLLHLV